MLVKLDADVAVDTDLIAWVKGERIGIDRPRTVSLIRLKDGNTLRVEVHPTTILEKIGAK